MRARRTEMDIRKTVTTIEDTLFEGDTRLEQPLRRVAVVAVVRNPLVTRDDENLGELMRDGEDLGRYLAQRSLEFVDSSPDVHSLQVAPGPGVPISHSSCPPRRTGYAGGSRRALHRGGPAGGV